MCCMMAHTIKLTFSAPSMQGQASGSCRAARGNALAGLCSISALQLLTGFSPKCSDANGREPIAGSPVDMPAKPMKSSPSGMTHPVHLAAGPAHAPAAQQQLTMVLTLNYGHQMEVPLSPCKPRLCHDAITCAAAVQGRTLYMVFML